MPTLVLIAGAGTDRGVYRATVEALSGLGHEAIVPAPPARRSAGGPSDHPDAVAEALPRAGELVVVAHSLGAFAGPLVATRVPVEHLHPARADDPDAGRDRRGMVGEHSARGGDRGLLKRRLSCQPPPRSDSCGAGVVSPCSWPLGVCSLSGASSCCDGLPLSPPQEAPRNATVTSRAAARVRMRAMPQDAHSGRG